MSGRQEACVTRGRYTQAAEQGNAQAQNSLAYCFRYGHGVRADKAEAIRLYAAPAAPAPALQPSRLTLFRSVRYRLAAAQGNAGAASELISMGLM